MPDAGHPGGPGLTMAERFEIFLGRLAEAPPPASFEEAYETVCETLNAVEDEFSGRPFDLKPDRQFDGRMYPPQADSFFAVDGHEEVTRLRSRGHNTFIRTNGAIEIQRIRGKKIELEKPGRDGRGVWSK